MIVNKTKFYKSGKLFFYITLSMLVRYPRRWGRDVRCIGVQEVTTVSFFPFFGIVKRAFFEPEWGWTAASTRFNHCDSKKVLLCMWYMNMFSVEKSMWKYTVLNCDFPVEVKLYAPHLNLQNNGSLRPIPFYYFHLFLIFHFYLFSSYCG